MEAKKIELEYNDSVKSRPQLQIVEAYESEHSKKNLLFLLTTFLVPFAGWTYMRKTEGLFISLSYLPVALVLFAPMIGWALFGIFHVTMTYLAYKEFSSQN